MVTEWLTTYDAISVDVGKVLIIGGGIANFTNVAATFKVLFLL